VGDVIVLVIMTFSVIIEMSLRCGVTNTMAEGVMIATMVSMAKVVRTQVIISFIVMPSIVMMGMVMV